MLNYTNAIQFLHQIDCLLTQYVYIPNAPDDGYFIRQDLIREIENFGKAPAIVLDQYKYMSSEEYINSVDYKLTQYIFIPNAPDDGYFIRQDLIREIESEFNRRLYKRSSYNSIIDQMKYHPHFISNCIHRFEDIEHFFEIMRC